VDDGSRDGTAKLLRIGAWPGEVKLVFHDRNRGKGAAVRTALVHASGEFAAVLDAHLEYRAADLPRCSRRCSPARPTSSSVHGLASPFFVRVLVRGRNKVVTFATNFLFNCWISPLPIDVTCPSTLRRALEAVEEA
jgi:glycosyltransferase involved in cell wall biosynthesis